jgi:adenylate cyclase
LGDGDAPALGYFPDSVIERIEEVRRLKTEGYTMAEIAARFGNRQEDAELPAPSQARAAVLGQTPAIASSETRGLQLTLDDIAHPAYMVNYNLELTWYNAPARTQILGFETPPPDSESRNIFLMLFDALGDCEPGRRNPLLRLHLELAKARLSKDSVLSLLKNNSRQYTNLLAEMYDDVPGGPGQTVAEVPYSLQQADGTVSDWKAYGLYFREGILIVHIPAERAEPGLLDFLSRRDVVIRNLLRKQLPVLTPLAVIVADLQNSVKICSELPPEEYFELINEIWSAMAPLFRKYYGTHGKHVGDGMVYYFFPQPDSNYLYNALLCAHEIRQEMRKISKQWQLRKNWLNELYLNTGLHEGQEWLGTFQSATSLEIAVLGDTINHAARLSDYARFGAIWATKSFVSKLSTDERARIQFGIMRRSDDGQEHFVSSSYSQLGTLVDLKSERNEKLRDIANLPITEIRGIRLD